MPCKTLVHKLHNLPTRCCQGQRMSSPGPARAATTGSRTNTSAPMAHLSPPRSKTKITQMTTGTPPPRRANASATA